MGISDGERPLISVITVTYNPGNALRKTMESVLSQSFTDYEYIIKDGGSTDDSAKIVDEYRDKFEAKGISFIYISKKDDGIYDAMNAAVAMSRGKWVNFMNAGDCFYSDKVLYNIFNDKKYLSVAILYGDAVECEYNHYYLFRKAFDQIEGRMPFSHQSAFVNRELMSRFPFKTKYKIGADYDFLLSSYKRGFKFCDTGEIVCIVSKDGVSSMKMYDTYEETMEIKRSNNVALPDENSQKKNLRVSKIKQFVIDNFPNCIKMIIRRIQLIVRHQNARLTIPYWEKEM